MSLGVVARGGIEDSGFPIKSGMTKGGRDRFADARDDTGRGRDRFADARDDRGRGGIASLTLAMTEVGAGNDRLRRLGSRGEE